MSTEYLKEPRYIKIYYARINLIGLAETIFPGNSNVGIPL